MILDQKVVWKRIVNKKKACRHHELFSSFHVCPMILSWMIGWCIATNPPPRFRFLIDSETVRYSRRLYLLKRGIYWKGYCSNNNKKLRVFSFKHRLSPSLGGHYLVFGHDPLTILGALLACLFACLLACLYNVWGSHSIVWLSICLQLVCIHRVLALCSVEHRGLDLIVEISCYFSCAHSVWL
jgi:hypothetical protein